MKRYLIIFLSLNFIPLVLYAQKGKINKDAESPSFRINALPLEFELEYSLNKNFTVLSTVGLTYSFNEGIQNLNFLVESNPYIQLFPRYYYNLDKRVRKGKKIAGFSGNYIGLFSVIHFKDIHEPESIYSENSFLAGPTWGIQRKINDVAHLDLFLGWGFGWAFERSNFTMSPITGLKIGFYIN